MQQPDDEDTMATVGPATAATVGPVQLASVRAPASSSASGQCYYANGMLGAADGGGRDC